MQNQLLRQQYIDKERLTQLLRNLFGSGGFEVEVRVIPVLLRRYHMLNGADFRLHIG